MSIDTTQAEKAVAAAATGATDWLRITNRLAVQVTGTATAVTVLVERSTRDPSAPDGPNIALVDTLTGNLATGLAPIGFEEPGSAWWRARATVVTGGAALLAVNGGWGG